MEQFPPNSRKAEQRTQEKRVERVVSANAVRRRKPLGKRFAQVFIGGDAKTAVEYMIGNVMIPAAKEALVEAMSSGFEKLIYGDTRPKRHPMHTPPSGPLGHVNYAGKSQPQQSRDPRLSRKARTRHSFDDIVINSRQDAEEVLSMMWELLDKYQSVTVADLYELTGLESSHIDFKWGWTKLTGATVGRVRGGGYLLDLPEPEYFE